MPASRARSSGKYLGSEATEAQFNRSLRLPAVPAIQPPTCIGCLTLRRCQRHNSRLFASYRVLRRLQRLDPDFHRISAISSTVSHAPACAWTCLLSGQQSNPDSRRRFDPLSTPATNCQLSSEPNCPAVRQFTLRLAPQPSSPVFRATHPPACAVGFPRPSAPADRFRFAPDSVLLSSPADPPPGLRPDASLWVCRRCTLWLTPPTTSSGLPAILSPAFAGARSFSPPFASTPGLRRNLTLPVCL